MIFVFVFGTRWMGGWIPDAAAARGKDPTPLWRLWRGGSSTPICPIESAPRMGLGTGMGWDTVNGVMYIFESRCKRSCICA